MRRFHGAGVGWLAGLGMLALGSTAQAQGSQATQGMQGVRGNDAEQSAGCSAQGEQGAPFMLGPLDTTAPGSAGVMSQRGAEGSAGMMEQGAAPVPQYWLADASLFVASADNAAQTLAGEQPLSVQAPSVLGNQAQFLLAAASRALSSLTALEANAEATNPHAVSEIRSAMNQLTAAKGQASQVLDATNNGTFGPNQQAAIRSAHEHLQAAERSIHAADRAYGFIPGSRGMAPRAAPEKAPAAPEKAPAAPEKGPAAPEPGKP